MASSSTTPVPRQGGAFLLTDGVAAEAFTPEDFTEEHRAVARTVDSFWESEVAPNVERVQHQEPGLAVSLLRKSAELGLLAVVVPEVYGGMEMDLTSAMIVAEGVAKDGSYSAWHGAHAGIGTLPILLFGSEQQKSKYLPKLTSAEWIAAYALSESHAGSDALAAKTRADLSPDGTHYILNGQKMWITNGGAADLFTVFAKIGGEQFTAFLVERSFPGVRSGNEERKMGIKGSSTTPVYFDNVPVPLENVLGEPGRGHAIAFNILNLGRLKLGPFAVGSAKAVLAVSARYAKERKAFGKTISDFGLIQQKLAAMAIQIYAAESMSYRTVGLIQDTLQDFSWQQSGAATRMVKAVEEFAIECSLVKVFASEMLDFVVDEGVQIHGGYGYHQDYAVECAYRDSRINRIFEGTNEINRLLATGMLLKRAQKGQLALAGAVKQLQADLLKGTGSGATELTAVLIVQNLKRIALLLLGAAYERFALALEEQQEVLAYIAEVVTLAYAAECVQLRTEKLGLRAGVARMMCSLFLEDAVIRAEGCARKTLASCSTGDDLLLKLTALRRMTRLPPLDSVAGGREVSNAVLAAGRYCI